MGVRDGESSRWEKQRKEESAGKSKLCIPSLTLSAVLLRSLGRSSGNFPPMDARQIDRKSIDQQCFDRTPQRIRATRCFETGSLHFGA
jgi:hypothetical protein